MPGLLRGIARTAVVAGTATAVSNRVSRRQANRWSQQEPASPPPEDEQQYEEPADQPPAGVDTDTKLAQLKELGELHNAGVLTDAEFAVQKDKILNS